jgi:2-polyprenyl-3-methyl-5-hydroxy-6-metoxy-1,4-benzoquinol methylase
MSDAKRHWETVYSSKPPSALSWYMPHMRLSLELIRRSGVTPHDFIIDVGGGESTLVDDLLDLGFQNITVLDVSSQALDVSKSRLAGRASMVEWIVEDIRRASLRKGQYRLWHDRAVFHFLTNPEDRTAYMGQVRKALSPGGFAVISTFSLDGPTQCSGLDVQRYSSETLLQELGPGFRLLETELETHRTPSGGKQEFIYCLFSLEAQHG